jgi:hypothetical protein
MSVCLGRNQAGTWGSVERPIRSSSLDQPSRDQRRQPAKDRRCSLVELMDDPLIGLVMKSDGVGRRELELLLERAARAASAGAPICRAPVNYRDNKPALAPDRS